MRRTSGIFITMMSVGVAMLLVSCGEKTKERTLNIYNWNDYIDEKSIPEFETKTGIKVIYDNYDSNEVIEAKLLAGGSGYDLVVPTADFAERFISAKLIQKIDKSKIPNLSNVDPSIYKKLEGYDPQNQYAVNYMWGTSGIGYNKTKIARALPNAPYDSWKLVIDPKNAQKLSTCGIALLDDPKDIYTNVIIALGLDPYKEDLKQLEQAQAALLKIRPFIKYFDSSRYLNDLANGEICVVVGYNGDIIQARDRAKESGFNDEIVYSIPKEGAVLWMDTLVIPADSKNVAEAHEFLNYFLTPEVTARITNHTYYANSNINSKEFIEKEIIDDPAVYPEDAIKEKLVPSRVNSQEYSRKQTQLWTELKATK
ncbi:MAG: polyamine ABC transporter substrate-binding protein [Methylacidiphilales bacterium]|nr:polyamine ABC transporter substrate-binding protein [Candidatus Methylacidiphilales bacterium]